MAEVVCATGPDANPAWLDQPVPRSDPETPDDADVLGRWQLARAWEVATDLAAANDFYRSRLGALPADRSAATFRTLPVTTKRDVVDDCTAHSPYGSRTTAAPADIRHVVETSGTSGEGREVYALDAVDERAVFEAEAVGFWWAGVRPGSRVLLTLPVGMSAAGLWYQGGLRLIGANLFAVGGYDTERKVAVLQRYGADVVIGTPSYLQKLAVACEQGGLEPASLGVGSLLVAGESYSLAWAREIEQRWNAKLHEQYGCTERAMGWTCPGGVIAGDELGVLHFPSELAYVEVIDPRTGEPANHGAHGELITTPLRAGASPLLRFATRDRVEYVAPGRCHCGRPLAGIRAGGVHRYDDMMKIRGVNVWPAAFDAAIFGVDGVVEYRGHVRRRADGSEYIAVSIECAVPPRREVLQQVSTAVRRVVGLGVDVVAVEPGEITGAVPDGFVKVARWQDRRGEIGSGTDDEGKW